MDTINPEIRKRILELIYMRLDNIGGENIFMNTAQQFFGATNPIYTHRCMTKQNIDVYEYDNHDCIRYSLVFPDGEPSICIITYGTYKETYENYKTVKRFGLSSKTYKSEFREWSFETIVSCGHIRFPLTDDEFTDLLDRTKKAYETYQNKKDDHLDKELMDKLNMRLNN